MFVLFDMFLLLFGGITDDGCKHCPAGWILRNSICYYFAFPEDGLKSWQNARDYCKVYGGDLAIIDSIDKEVD